MRRRILSSITIVASVLTLVAGVLAQSAGVHPVSGRPFADVMGFAGAEWLERSERESEEAPAKALDAIGIQAGSTVADIGAGTGYFTVRLAERVGPTGKVYANDIQPEMLELLRQRLETGHITNVTLVRGAIDDPKLPPSAIDLALLVDVYHEFSQPQAMLRHLRDALKPRGRLVLLEYRKEDPTIPIRLEHEMTVAEAKLEVEHEGYHLAQVNEDLPRQHILVFSK